VIDVHTHVFATAEAGRSWQASAGFDPVRPGTVEDIGPRLEAAGTERAVVLIFPRSFLELQAMRASAAPGTRDEDLRQPIADRLRAANRWACELARRDHRFLAFVGVDPTVLTAAEIGAEIEAAAAAGASGVKIIPGAMRRYPDDESLEPVYTGCVATDLPLLSQSGTGGVSPHGPRGPFGRPVGFGPVLAAYPTLQLILAHLGRGADEELVDLFAAHPGVVGDTSLRLGSPHDTDDWEPGPIRELIRRLGPERVLFGTNYPIVDPVLYRERFDELGLSLAERDLVGAENARRVLRL
jgi:predicted TIM-barrel fold metal-dependent hydrolase